MTDHVESYAQAILDIARAEGKLGVVEDELFRFARALEDHEELRSAVSDPVLPAERRMAVVEELLGAGALGLTGALASFLVGAGRGAELPEIVDRFVALAVEMREREVAEVRSAVELDAATREELTRALSEATGKRIELKVVVDTSVLGGIVARIGDTVIDGSVRRRLAQMKEQI